MEPFNDRRFMACLVGYGIVLAACWTIFINYLLPTFPENPLKGCIAIVGLVIIMIVLGLLFVDVYEKPRK
jgi:hypothetical protein